jgi:crotonobetainyl-CoA:carnitine CoA-transferase CaiB-like acyl-CoA transferase
MKSYDMLLQAETGLADVTGRPEGPGRVGVSVCDIAAGMYAHQATLEALLERATTGKGAHIEVSLFDGMAEWMAVPLLHFDYLGKAPLRVGLAHPSIAPYSDFVTKDGVRIVISIQNEREWADFCAGVLGEPGFATHPNYASNVSRVKNRAALDAKIAVFFAARTKDEMAKLLSAARTAYGVANTVAEFSKHPQLRRVTVATQSGEVNLPAPPPIVNGERAPALGAVPRVGEHSAAIRAEFA